MTEKLIPLPIIPKWTGKYIKSMEDSDFGDFPAYDTFQQLTNNIRQAILIDYEKNPEKVKDIFMCKSLDELKDRYKWLFVNVDAVFTAIMYGYEVLTKEQVIEKYKAGFSVGKDFATVEWLLNEKITSEDNLCFQAYDANMMALPNLGEWPDKEVRLKQIDFMLDKLKDWHGSVYLDDMKIK